jgi:hypothetical protein
MSAITIANRFECLKFFKDKLILFLDCLMDLLPSEKDLVILRVLFENQIPMETAIQIFSSRIIPYRKMVEQRDERFFLECTDLFSGIKKDKVSYFKDLWQSDDLTEDDKVELWKWFNLFLKIALKYESLQS